MVQVDGSPYGLEEGLVRPPDADALWEWYVRTGRDERDPDPSWGDVWDSARHLAAYVKRGGGDITGERVVELGWSPTPTSGKSLSLWADPTRTMTAPRVVHPT